VDIATAPRRTIAGPTQEQVARFASDGYLVLKNYLRDFDRFNKLIESIVRARADEPILMRYEKPLSLKDLGYTFDDFMRKSSSLRIPEIHSISAELRELIAECAFETYLAPFMGAKRADFLQSLYFPFSSQQASHSDKFLVSPPANPYNRETLIGVWLALDPTTRLNGPLFGWTGSQKVAPKPFFGDYKRYGDYSRDLAVTMANAGLTPHFIYVEAGDVVLWASDFVHGGAKPLKSDVTRRALVLHYGARLEA
jgi:phytanoyl-CoA dioxygenase PhyH